ncbi:MAG: aminotransferase class I/II-fold pyridoxal phosphate-dependent enzyme, partial [Rhodospirillaceae bacterium]
MIPNCIPELIGKEADYVAQAIADGWIAVGPQIGEFEKRVAAFAGARHAVAVNSGTAALHLALVCAGVGVDDEVVVPALTFAASANAVRHCGAFPVFADSETT